MYRYMIQDDQTESFLAIQRMAEKIYANYGCKSVHMKSNDDVSVWVEIHHYQDKEHYLHATALVNSHVEIGQLYEKFLKVLIPDRPIIEEEFTVIEL